MEENSRSENFDFNFMFGTINCIKLISEADEFNYWLKTEHHMKEDQIEKVYEGYLYAFETLTRMLMDRIISETSFKIKEDYFLYRASHAGINIDNIPNTCEKTKILKKINVELLKIKKSKDFNEFQKQYNYFKKSIIVPFEELFTTFHQNDNCDLSLEEALNYCSQYTTYIFLNDTQRMVPHGFYVSILDNKLDNKNKNSNKIFNGYKYSIQFLWTRLLGNEYDKTSLKLIHTTKFWATESDLFSVYFEKNKNLLKHEETFDSYFGKIREEVILNEKNRKFDIQNTFFLMKENIDNTKIIKKLISNSIPVKELSIDEEIDQFLYWHNKVELLTSSKFDIFNGVAAFINSLVGAVELKKQFGIKETVIVRRFIHPNEAIHGGGNDYSYGLLIEAASNIADYSGWLIFFDCCTDYSGFGESEHNIAEMIIKEYEENERIEVKEKRIEKDELYRILFKSITVRYEEDVESMERYHSLACHHQDITRENKELKTKLNYAKGTLNELLAYYLEVSENIILDKNYKNVGDKINELDINLDLKNKIRMIFEDNIQQNKKRIEWGERIKNGECDVWIETESKIKIIECKADLNTRNIERDVEKYRNREKNIIENQKKEVETLFYYFEKPERLEVLSRLKEMKINYLIINQQLKQMGKKTQNIEKIFEK